jgi:hypothetical protein
MVRDFSQRDAREPLTTSPICLAREQGGAGAGLPSAIAALLGVLWVWAGDEDIGALPVFAQYVLVRTISSSAQNTTDAGHDVGTHTSG